LACAAAMISFTGLFLPFFVIASLVSGVAVTDLQSLHIDTITVPDSMQRRGYSPIVFIRMMNDELLDIEATAKTRTDAQKLRTENEKGVVEVAVGMLKMTALVRAVQESSNLIEFTVNGEIVERDSDYLLRLRIERYGHKVVLIEATAPQGDVQNLAHAGAERIMKITDPQVFCAAIMQTEAKTIVPIDGKYYFTETNECIRETLPTAQDDDHLWLLNLQGVVAFVGERPNDAAMHFRSAIRRDPEFTPALLNLGILYAHSGRPKRAIGYFQQVFNHELPAHSPQTFAATYTEWADALVAVGQGAEADAMFRMATVSDPKYADAYFRWARHTADPAKAAELRARGEAIAKEYGDLYTDNLIGKLREAAAKSNPLAPGASENLEGDLGDVGLLAEPGRDRTMWDYLGHIWENL
jgi:tetratricopeptide (TPR) repeat protein